MDRSASLRGSVPRQQLSNVPLSASIDVLLRRRISYRKFYRIPVKSAATRPIAAADETWTDPLGGLSGTLATNLQSDVVLKPKQDSHHIFQTKSQSVFPTFVQHFCTFFFTRQKALLHIKQKPKRQPGF